MASDWTNERTVSPASNIEITYTTPAGATKKVSLRSTASTETETTFTDYSYTDKEGKEQSSEVASSKRSEARNTVAAVNGPLVVYRLSNGLSLPSGDASTLSSTSYAYVTTRDGPRLTREVTIEYKTDFELAGALNISDYSGWEPTGATFVSSVTTIEYDEKTGEQSRPYTQTITSRRLAWGLTQRGQQAAAEMFGSASPADYGDIVEAMAELVDEGAEVRTSIGKVPTPGRPSGVEPAIDDINKPGEEPVDPEPPDDWSDGGGGWPSLPPIRLDIDLGGGEPYLPQLPTDPDPPEFPFGPPEVPWQDFDQDTDDDGIPDWAQYVPPETNWESYVGDTNSDGVPDWADYVPTIGEATVEGPGVVYDMPWPPDDAIYLQPLWNKFVPVGHTWQEYALLPRLAYDRPAWTALLPPGERSQDYAGFVVVLVPGGGVAGGGAGPGGVIGEVQAYGELQHALTLGHAYGLSVTAPIHTLPSEPASPAYLEAAGLSVTLLLNGTSWALDQNGIVAATDGLLVGVAGRTVA